MTSSTYQPLFSSMLAFQTWQVSVHMFIDLPVLIMPQADGYIARRFNMGSVLGTILDPAADKTLMTTLTVTLAMKGLLPGQS